MITQETIDNANAFHKYLELKTDRVFAIRNRSSFRQPSELSFRNHPHEYPPVLVCEDTEGSAIFGIHSMRKLKGLQEIKDTIIRLGIGGNTGWIDCLMYVDLSKPGLLPLLEVLSFGLKMGDEYSNDDCFRRDAKKWPRAGEFLKTRNENIVNDRKKIAAHGLNQFTHNSKEFAPDELREMLIKAAEEIGLGTPVFKRSQPYDLTSRREEAAASRA